MFCSDIAFNLSLSLSACRLSLLLRAPHYFSCGIGSPVPATKAIYVAPIISIEIVPSIDPSNPAWKIMSSAWFSSPALHFLFFSCMAVLLVELDYIFCWTTKVYLIFTQVRANSWGTNYNDPGKERSLCIAQSCKVGHCQHPHPHQYPHHRHHHRHRHNHHLGLNVKIAFLSGLQTQISLFLGRTRVKTSLLANPKKTLHLLFWYCCRSICDP